MSVYEKHLSEPWFSLIKLGLKKVEGRINRGDFKNMNVGDIVKWTNSDFMQRSISTVILDKINYKSYNEYLYAEGLSNCLPGFDSISDGLSVYHKYYDIKDETTFGIVAIKFKIID